MKQGKLTGLIAALLLSLTPGFAQTVIIGFTTSQTGSLTKGSKEQLRGYELWRDQVNAAGGLDVGGKRYKVQFVQHDDKSSSVSVQQLYKGLIENDQVDFLFSPYSSGLADAAAAVTEKNGKIMIITNAAEEKTYKQGNRYLYQMFTPASEYLSGALNILKKADGNSNVAFVYADDSFSSLAARAGKAHAQLASMKIALDEPYPANTKDFSAIVEKIRSAKATAVIGGGHHTDGLALARQLHDAKINLKLIVLLVAPVSPQFADLGDAAYGVAVPSQWEPESVFKPQIGPTSAEFAKAFEAKYNTTPSYEAAGAYASGLVLQHAVEHAESTETAKVANALNNTDLTTFFGRTKFMTTAAEHGLQLTHSMVLVQWQKDRSGKLVKRIVWPEGAKNADFVPLGQ